MRNSVRKQAVYYRGNFTPLITNYHFFRISYVFGSYKGLQYSPIFHLKSFQKSICVQPASCISCIRGAADKSLTRPGRKQATATKLGIYSTNSPRRSVHFLDRCSNFCMLLKKKKIQKFDRSNSSPRQQWPPRRTKNGDLSIVFSVQGTGGSPMGPDPENRVGDQDTRSPGRPVSSALQVSGEHLRARTKPPWWTSAAFFLQNVLQLHQQRWVILRVDRLAPWKIITKDDAVLIGKNGGQNFPADFSTRNFLGRGEPLCRYSTDCCFVSGS